MVSRRDERCPYSPRDTFNRLCLEGFHRAKLWFRSLRFNYLDEAHAIAMTVHNQWSCVWWKPFECEMCKILPSSNQSSSITKSIFVDSVWSNQCQLHHLMQTPRCSEMRRDTTASWQWMGEKHPSRVEKKNCWLWCGNSIHVSLDILLSMSIKHNRP